MEIVDVFRQKVGKKLGRDLKGRKSKKNYEYLKACNCLKVVICGKYKN